jgi:hypothetical protein
MHDLFQAMPPGPGYPLPEKVANMPRLRSRPDRVATIEVLSASIDAKQKRDQADHEWLSFANVVQYARTN